MKEKLSTGKVFSYLFMIIISAISILPIMWVVISSFKTNKEIMDSAISFPSGLNFEGYKTALRIAPIMRSYINSIIVSVTSTALNIMIIGMAAYVLARFSFRFKKTVETILSISLLLPMVALIHPIYRLINGVNLYNTKTSLIIVYTALGLPTTLNIMKSYFMGIPYSIEEAAYIDGSTFLNTYVKIVMPIAKPGFASAAVLQFLMAWNEFLYALILTNNISSRTLPLALSYFKSQFSFDYGAMFAAIVMVIIPSIVIYVLLQEQVVDSLAAGSVKG